MGPLISKPLVRSHTPTLKSLPGSQHINMEDMKNYLNKSKQDIIHFLNKACDDHHSSEYKELYNNLLKTFVDSDKNKDGTVDFAGFNHLVETSALTPRAYGFAPKDEDTYANSAERDAARMKMFKAMDKDNSSTITFNEFLNYTITHITKKLKTVSAHPNIETNDKAKFQENMRKALWGGNDATANIGAFTVMVDKAVYPARKLGLFKAEMNDEEMEKVFKKISSNGCLVSWDEFLGYALTKLFKNYTY